MTMGCEKQVEKLGVDGLVRSTLGSPLWGSWHGVSRD